MANLLACNCKYGMAGRLIRTRREPQLGKTKGRIKMCKRFSSSCLKQLSNKQATSKQALALLSDEAGGCAS